MTENYIYEVEGVSLPFNRYENDSDNIFYYYKRQTPKQTITVQHTPNHPTEIDIYNDPRYHDIDTDEEIDMDYYEDNDEDENVDADSAEDVKGKGQGQGQGQGQEDDLLGKLTKYLATIPTFVAPIPRIDILNSPFSATPPPTQPPTPPPPPPPEKSKRLTKKNRHRPHSREHIRHTKHANRALPKSFY